MFGWNEEDPPLAGQWLILAIIAGVIVVGGVTDLLLDAPDRWLTFHVLFEVGMVVGGLAGSVFLWRRWYAASRALHRMQGVLLAQQAERDRWRESARKALDGLAEAIDQEFAGWNLTPAERDTAIALLKGWSHKAIAARTNRSERTVRQHAVAVYRKSGLGGRAELSAFFLEDLSLPAAAREMSPPSPATERAP